MNSAHRIAGLESGLALEGSKITKVEKESVFPRGGRPPNIKKRGHRFSALWLLCAVLTLFPLLSPEKSWAAFPLSGSGSASKPSEPPAAGEDPLGRSASFGTIRGFILAAEGEAYKRASRYLEGKQSAKRKEELAALLKIVLDRGGAVDLNELRRKPQGDLDDTLPPNLEKVGVAKYGAESLDILLRRIYPKGVLPIWLFSSDTLQVIPDAAEQLCLTLGERIWPKSIRETRFLSVPLSQLISILLLILLFLGFSWVLTRGLFRILRPFCLRLIKDLSEAELRESAGLPGGQQGRKNGG